MIEVFEKELGLSAFPESFRKIYDAAMAEYDREGVFFLKDKVNAEDHIIVHASA